MVTISRVEHAGKIRGAGRTSAGSNDGLTAENTGCDFVRLAKEGLLCGVFVCTEILFNIFLKDAKKKNNNDRLSYKLYSRDESNISTYLAEQPK